ITVAGSLTAPESEVCRNMYPENITLSGHAGSIVRWQKSPVADFTSGVTNIASTSNVLTGSQIGIVTSTTFVRALVQNGSCAQQYTEPFKITVGSVVTFSGSGWSETPTPGSDIIVSQNYTLPYDMTVCSCKVSGTASLTIPSGRTLTV